MSEKPIYDLKPFLRKYKKGEISDEEMDDYVEIYRQSWMDTKHNW